jgi:hypothetical protein
MTAAARDRCHRAVIGAGEHRRMMLVPRALVPRFSLLAVTAAALGGLVELLALWRSRHRRHSDS